MTDFWFYFQTGLAHITDLNGYDHILFIVAVCVVYSLNEWKKAAWLITAFTLGHSLMLALATLKLIEVPTKFIEFLIPVTIVITCFVNFSDRAAQPRRDGRQNKTWQRYALAAFFGLIHGMGFSNFLRSILGKENDLLSPLLAFNLGLEAGQLVIVATVLLISTVTIRLFSVKPREWILVASAMTAGVALTLVQKNWILLLS